LTRTLPFDEARAGSWPVRLQNEVRRSPSRSTGPASGWHCGWRSGSSRRSGQRWQEPPPACAVRGRPAPARRLHRNRRRVRGPARFFNPLRERRVHRRRPVRAAGQPRLSGTGGAGWATGTAGSGPAYGCGAPGPLYIGGRWPHTRNGCACADHLSHCVHTAPDTSLGHGGPAQQGEAEAGGSARRQSGRAVSAEGVGRAWVRAGSGWAVSLDPCAGDAAGRPGRVLPVFRQRAPASLAERAVFASGRAGGRRAEDPPPGPRPSGRNRSPEADPPGQK